MFNFFRRIQSVLTADTKLEIHHFADVAKQLENARTILGHLLPFIDGIHMLDTDDRMLPIVEAFPREKLNQVKVLDVFILTGFVPSTVQPIMEWLTTSSNEPKLLQLGAGNGIAEQILVAIRKVFSVSFKNVKLFFSNSWKRTNHRHLL